ncbi:MAG: TonB-dependent receptor [Ignavibacteriales bacterium]|nr:TonB-dependent receptor [Ignavibacteriales bacterium]
MENKLNYHKGSKVKIVKKRTIQFLLFLMFISGQVNSILSQNFGKITGTIVDKDFGDALIGANVFIEGTTRGAATDIEGNYSIEGIEPGIYKITYSMVGFQKQTISDLEIKPQENLKLDIVLSTEAFETEEVVISAKSLTNTEGALLAKRQKSASVSDAISAEAMSNSGSSDAADAMKKVTGASVVGGKYVYVRGLGERYSSTTLNGAELPSADPDKKSFQLDLFPASLLDNITTVKTFTPDKPGTFTGGLVDVTMKSFPEKFSFNFSTSTGYNTMATFNDNFILPNSGGTDWLGIDDGTRKLPDLLSNSNIDIPRYTSVKTKEEALYLDGLSKSFNTHMTPVAAKAGMNSGMSISAGNQFDFANQTFGYLASLTWSQKYSYYDNGEIGRYKLPGTVSDIEYLNPERQFNDEKGVQEANWGAIVSLSMKNDSYGQFKGSYLRTQSGESTARYITGKWSDIPSTATYETRVLQYVQRGLDTYQFEGDHFIKAFSNLKMDWKLSYSMNEQDEPDLRYFSDHWTVKASTGDITYQSPSSLYPPPIRYFRNLKENSFTGNLNFMLPFDLIDGNKAKFQFGAAFNNVDRSYIQRRFEYEADAIRFSDYKGDIDAFFNTVGILDTSNSYFDFGNVIGESKSLKNKFNGDQKTTAGYIMFDLPIIQDLRFIGGLRLESTEMNAISGDETLPKGHLNNTDLLGSVNFIYALSENMNLRLAYSNTVARPTFRELAPYTNFEFVGDYLFVGNADLKRTLIRNYDVRWEWFTNPGELIAVSGFYKSFTDPIEKYQNNSIPNGLLSVQNVDKASLYGLEFEIRKNLGIVGSFLNNFSLGTNLSLVHSETEIPETEYFLIEISDPTASKTRPFMGQSPYLLNLSLGYDNYDLDFNAGIFYNIFGDRLAIVTEGANPDVYERGRGDLDFKISKGLFDLLNLSFTAKNLLDSDVKFSQEFKGTDYNYYKYRNGRTFSLSLKLKI